ncbi:DUF2511 domain-containing protein [Pseudomonas alkylphenolica]|uniref:DUF2511 domain-containing protein n=1 Tax=Pseudomonas alkylphenolica TaxID=237609 RepID=A0A6I6HDM0_9PSED|nr:DUF2511 domain-containing protein [Pseudomonas alkylphenolica]QGW78475.1 DUF2511 domain-containing protein [Pseudomonas alkylphenolica]
MIKGISVPALLVVTLSMAGCGADEKVQRVSSNDYGDSWPFTVEALDLMCEGPSPKALARTLDGTVYALSGSARSAAKERGWSDGQEITKPAPSMPGVKMDYSDFVQRAQALCGGA